MSDEFGGAGQNAGLEIWRVEKKVIKRWSSNLYGQFYSGDAYLILKTNAKANRLSWDLHFWLGESCSQDEAGIAAYKTVELDDLLGGAPIQHREVQGHESQLFLSYFKDGIQYMDGGIESGFNHVDPSAYEPRLFQVKGKRSVRVQQVEKSFRSLNDGDVFILDLGLTIFQWNGSKANKYEKFKGLEMTQKIKMQERGGKPVVVYLDAKSTDGDAEGQPFWALLGGSPAEVAPEEAGGSDDDQPSVEPSMHKIAKDQPTQPVSAGKNMNSTDLSSDAVYLVDSGSEVFVWIGRNSPLDDRKDAMSKASQYLVDAQRPSWTPTTRLLETGETPVFKSIFSRWDRAAPPAVARGKSFAVASSPASSKPAPAEQKADVSELFNRKSAAASDLADDGSGQIQVWRIENFQKVAVAADQHGQFYSGDSYIILYTYLKKNRPFYIIYFWQGRDSSADEKGASALLAVELDDSLKGEPTQVRVTQGKEPDHFLLIFRGQFVVHRGGVASGFANRKGASSESSTAVSLYHVRGTTPLNTRAIQVDEVASSLNSGDSFVLNTPSAQYIWFGQYASADEQTLAKTVASKLKGSDSSVVEIKEGQESEDFWTALGGKTSYTNVAPVDDGVFEPRLLHCSNVTGVFKIEEVFNYTQEDLISEDIMILDVYSDVYVWVGKESNKQEKDQAFQAALDYVANAPDGRDKDTPIYRIEEGNEPRPFTAAFLDWKEKETFEDPYAKKLALLKGDAAASASSSSSASVADVSAQLKRVSVVDIGFDSSTKYTLAQLQDKANVPPNIDVTKKENYLLDADFPAAFKMSRDDFSKLAGWKQADLKKKAGLF